MKRSLAPSVLAAKRACLPPGVAPAAAAVVVRPKENAPPPPEADTSDTNSDGSSSTSTSTSASPVASRPLTKPLLGSPKPLIRPLLKPLVRSSVSTPTSTTNSEPSSPSSSSSSSAPPSPAAEQPIDRIFEVYWCKRSNKKHKSHEDGILRVRGNSCSLFDTEGKELSKGTSFPVAKLRALAVGQSFSFGGKEMELITERSVDDFNRGTIFGATQSAAPTPTSLASCASSKLVNKKFKRHFADREVVAAPLKPMFDPTAEGALVVYDAGESLVDTNGKPHVSVVVDPVIAKHLRAHQRDGVQFMFDTIIGRNAPYFGCILADDMGLGKTLQSIALIYTAIKQGPHGSPLTSRAMIVAPSSLVENWEKEFKRWLGIRINPITAGGSCSGAEVEKLLQQFSISTSREVLIISYGYFRKFQDRIHKIPCDLIVCDEAHKVKNSTSQIAQAVAQMPTKRRILLTGTPIQNDLEEFYVMCDIVNPGILGQLASFKRVFEKSINIGHSPSATPDEKREASARAQELSRRTNQFILRRTAAILIPYLPPKMELVLFCRLGDLQTTLYQALLRSKRAKFHSTGDNSFALECMQLTSKLCNHPALVFNKFMADPDLVSSCKSAFPEGFSPSTIDPEFSGKMLVLDALLKSFKANNERVVIVSNYTKTLNVIQELCSTLKYSFSRLDGQTETKKRQQLVDSFNASYSRCFVFLLSSKAGGVGLNLIGANRLVLFDPDWNPANDRQSMARIWRDGQRLPVFIYRLISTGTVEEKIFQRQLKKQCLSSSVVDDHFETQGKFEQEDLKRVFQLNTNTTCETHELLGCSCHVDGFVQVTAQPGSRLKKHQKAEEAFSATQLKSLDNWRHFPDHSRAPDSVLSTLECNNLTFVFESRTKELTEWPTSSSTSQPVHAVATTSSLSLSLSSQSQPQSQSQSQSQPPASSSSATNSNNDTGLDDLLAEIEADADEDDLITVPPSPPPPPTSDEAQSTGSRNSMRAMDFVAIDPSELERPFDWEADDGTT